MQQNDTVMLDIETGKIKDFIKFGVGNLCMITGGTNNGRVGTIVHQEHHKGSFEIIHIKDAAGTISQATLVSNLECLFLQHLVAGSLNHRFVFRRS